MPRIQLLVTVCFALSGCATTSFAPPEIERYHAMTSGSLGPNCTLTKSMGADIHDDVAGARALIKNHIATYDCAMRLTANGRQWFEIPSFVSLIGATAAVALGAGKNVAFIGQSANSVFTAGNNYYAPQEQTTIMRSAFDAINCIEAEASGISAYEVAEASAAQKTMLEEKRGASVQITAEQQYYDLIQSRLGAVDGAAAERLAKRGTFDVAGIAAEVEKASDAQKKAEDKQANPGSALTVSSLFTGERATAHLINQMVQLDIDVLRPKLDKCVLRAKA